MVKLHFVCECNSTTFKIQKDTGLYSDTYECVCSECGKSIATISHYNINWITEEEKADEEAYKPFD